MNNKCNCNPEIHNGDSYNIQLTVTVNDKPIQLPFVELIEFNIGGIIKKWPLEVQHDQGLDVFLFPLSQEESFQLEPISLYQARIKYNNGDVYASPVYRIEIKKVISQDVL